MILLLSTFFLFVITILVYVGRNEKGCIIKSVIISGICFGLVAIGLNSLFKNAFGASTPVNIKIDNKTNETLKLYSIIFWVNNLDQEQNSVTYHKKIQPNDKSEFWFESDGTYEYWIVAKNDKNNINFITVQSAQVDNLELTISRFEVSNQNEVDNAIMLTNKADQEELFGKILVMINIILIALLAIRYFR